MVTPLSLVQLERGAERNESTLGYLLPKGAESRRRRGKETRQREEGRGRKREREREGHTVVIGRTNGHG